MIDNNKTGSSTAISSSFSMSLEASSREKRRRRSMKSSLISVVVLLASCCVADTVDPNIAAAAASNNGASAGSGNLAEAALNEEASNLFETLWESLKSGLQQQQLGAQYHHHTTTTSQSSTTTTNLVSSTSTKRAAAAAAAAGVSSHSTTTTTTTATTSTTAPTTATRNRGRSTGSSGSGSGSGSSKSSHNYHELPHANKRKALFMHSLHNHYYSLLKHQQRKDQQSLNETNNSGADANYFNDLGEILYTYLHPSSSSSSGQAPTESSASSASSPPPPPDHTTSQQIALPPFPVSMKERNLQLIRDMFAHAYDSYMLYAYPYGEIKPFTCAGGTFDLVRLPALTLIDSLDTLLILGNTTEFARSVERLKILNQQMVGEGGGGIFALNQNVSVFETNIRVLGGLLSAHQMALQYTNRKVLEFQVWTDKHKQKIKWEHDKYDKPSFVLDYVLKTSGARPKTTTTSTEDEVFNWDVDDSDSNFDLLCSSEPDEMEQQQCLTSSSPATGRSSTTDKKQNTTKNAPKYWVYDGFLLKLAHDIGLRLLPAFQSKTGIPYGTVNLLYGVPPGETPVASLAGGGTLTLEMELLSRLTGDESFGKAAKLASRALWLRRSSLNLLGKHINIHNGAWTEHLSGVGSNSDSFYEYLAKHYMLFPEDNDFWYMLIAAYSGIHRDTRLGEWYVDVDMNIGLRMGTYATGGRKLFESLMAFYPGMQSLLGELVPAAKSLNSFFMLREFLGFLPERFDYGMWKTESHRDGSNIHPLRPELLESSYFLHRATQQQQKISSSLSSSWQWASHFALHALENVARTNCGYATIIDVSATTTGSILASTSTEGIRWIDEMPSFFLSETLKYLYLTFDEDNILHDENNDYEWIFTTEAHPIHHVPPVVRSGSSSGDDGGDDDDSTGDDDDRNIKQRRTSASDIEDRFEKLERYRLIVKERLMNDINNEKDQNNADVNDINRAPQEDTLAERLRREKWTESTTRHAYVKAIKAVADDISEGRKDMKLKKIREKRTKMKRIREGFTDKNASIGQYHPHYFTEYFFSDTGLIERLDNNGVKGIIKNDYFNEIQLGNNLAHLTFKNSGFGDGIFLRKACPNYYSSELLLLNALNGGSLDYSDIYLSSTSDEVQYQQHNQSPFVLFGAVDALGFHGSGIYLGQQQQQSGSSGQGDDNIDEKCFIESHTITENSSGGAASENDNIKKNGNDNTAGGSSTSSPSRSSSPRRGERVDMGNGLGVFDIFAFSEGTGFYMEHVDSGESVMATFIVDDFAPPPPSTTTVGDDAMPQVYIMTYATVPQATDGNNSDNRTGKEHGEYEESGSSDEESWEDDYYYDDYGNEMMDSNTPWHFVGPSWASLTLKKKKTTATKKSTTSSEEQHEHLSEEGGEQQPPSPPPPERTIVMADFNGNAFICEIKMIKRPLILYEDAATNEEAYDYMEAAADEDPDSGLLIENDDDYFDENDDDSTASTSASSRIHHYDEKDDIVVGQYPCAPALFGPTHISKLLETNGVFVELEVLPPKQSDEFGCGRNNGMDVNNKSGSNEDINLDLDDMQHGSEPNGQVDANVGADSNIDQYESEEDENEQHLNSKFVQNDHNSFSSSAASESQNNDEGVDVPSIVQIVHRGVCTFRSKAVQQRKESNAEVVIVVNNEDEELFVMSHGREEDDGEEVPITLLVSGLDGKDMLGLVGMDSEESDTANYEHARCRSEDKSSNGDKSDEIECDEDYTLLAQISLLPQEGTIDRSGSVTAGSGGNIDWPVVKGSPDSLQIFAKGGWGIHAVPRENTKQQQQAQAQQQEEQEEQNQNQQHRQRSFSFDWQLFLLRHSAS